MTQAEVLGALFALGATGGPIDVDARKALEDELVRGFAASPEASSLPGIEWCHLLMALAAAYFERTIATLDADSLRALLFKVIPHEVSIEAAAARPLIEEMRAFFGYLARAFSHPHAEACLRVLDGNATARLETALADSSNFGMAKSFAMAEQAIGVRAGPDAWARVAKPAASPAAVSRPVDRAVARAKKATRKAARDARKKNR